MEKLAVVIDTREQEPYGFDPSRVAPVRRALPAGDYSLAGHEDRVAVERKTLDDFVASAVKDRVRFGRELRAFAAYEFACVVVEATLEDVLAHRYRSATHPNAVFGAALAITVDLGVPVFFCGDRQIACLVVEGLLARFHRKVTGRCPYPPTLP